MEIRCIWEHNKDDSLIYTEYPIGAYARGESFDVAVNKLESEIKSYFNWLGVNFYEDINFLIVQSKESELSIKDADSDIIFDSEVPPLTFEEYKVLKELALKSALDFQRLYNSITDKNSPIRPQRATFYGDVPCTASQMYEHTKNVNSYYFGEINICADNGADIYNCRLNGFIKLENSSDYLLNKIYVGSYGEKWSLRKMIRRFIWHDRIHAKAMYRCALRTFGADRVENIFKF